VLSAVWVSEHVMCGVCGAVSTCETVCGTNSMCVGDWAKPDVLKCKCVSDSFYSPTGDGANCVGMVECVLLHCAMHDSF
jgi:hypothetical protein